MTAARKGALSVLLEELQRFEAKATPGPWQVYTSNSFRRIGLRGTHSELISPTTAKSDGHPDLTGRNVDADLDLLVALRNAFPLLVTGIEAQKVQIESMRLVLSVVAAKAEIPTAQLIDMLDEAERGVRGGDPVLSKAMH